MNNHKMKVCNFIFMLCMALQAYQSDLSAQKTSDSLEFSGQLTGWGGFSFKNPGIQQLGIRYLPELSYSVHNAHNLNFDIDASVNSYSNIRFDQLHYDTIQAGIRAFSKNQFGSVGDTGRITEDFFWLCFHSAPAYVVR
jgi:hypothetical protein